MKPVMKWLSLRKCRAFVKEQHRHCKMPQGGIVGLGAWKDGELIGVCILGRPNARMDSSEMVEITRVCTNGYRNLCSALYGKAKRLAQALGFTKIKTFNLPEESGASLRAVGAKLDGITDGGLWEREGRPRADENQGQKIRWRLE